MTRYSGTRAELSFNGKPVERLTDATFSARARLEGEIAREQGRVDEMRRRQAKGRHGGYDQEIDEVEGNLASMRAQLARLAPPVVIFMRPSRQLARTAPSLDGITGLNFEDGSHIPRRTHGFEVARRGQTVRRVGGRARIFDSFDLLIGGQLYLSGTRREVMYQAMRLAQVNELGELPLYLQDNLPSHWAYELRRERQIENRRARRKNRRTRNQIKLLVRAITPTIVDSVMRTLSRQTIFPKLLTRSPL